MRTLLSLMGDGYIVIVAVASSALIIEIIIQHRKGSSLGIMIGLHLLYLSAILFILHRLIQSNIALVGTYVVSFIGVGMILYTGYQDAKRTDDKKALAMKRMIIIWMIILATCILTLAAAFIMKKASGI